ncbi:MAG: CRISPR-associated ring nuclease [Verrucomicrobiae bacterium]|nr:CRISPR-associated ring nuclease [Verrucomicrobiae bacterium]
MKHDKLVLLCSLGTSWQIVPEAFLFPECKFDEVHIITSQSAGNLDKIRDFFKNNAPNVELTFTRVKGFVDFKSEQDHFNFEEILYRWILEKRERSSIPPYICLAGGFKTMSSAMQKAAEILGASQIYHVLCNTNPQPQNESEILKAYEENKLVWIKLGKETGWPQFKSISPKEFHLIVEEEEENGIKVRIASVSGHTLRQRLRNYLEQSHRIAGSWDKLKDLPFSTLATWSKSELEWLEQPLSKSDFQWLKKLPKIELHCHLGGFGTHGELLKTIRASAKHTEKLPPPVKIDYPPNWPLPEKPITLEKYMELGNAGGSTILKDPGCLEEHCRHLYKHLVSENVVYAEIRCSPANYAEKSTNRSPWDVLVHIREVFNDCMEEHKKQNPASTTTCHVNLILIATRRKETSDRIGDSRAEIARHLSLAITAFEHWTDPDSCRVVGVDLAGYEDKNTRPHYYQEEFTPVHRCGLALTVHAGEIDEAESIWEAVFKLNARRLGHALSLRKYPELIRSIADRGIAIEMCPYANYQIKGYRLLESNNEYKPQNPEIYPLKYYLDNGIRVTVNTDNIGISNASITDNFDLLTKLNPTLTRLDILRLIKNSIDSTFLSSAKKSELSCKIESSIPLPI